MLYVMSGRGKEVSVLPCIKKYSDICVEKSPTIEMVTLLITNGTTSGIAHQSAIQEIVKNLPITKVDIKVSAGIRNVGDGYLKSVIKAQWSN